MRKVLIMCDSDPGRDPRPNRMIHWLKDDYQVTVIGRNNVQIERVESIAFVTSGHTTTTSRIATALPGKIRGVIRRSIGLARTPIRLVRIGSGRFEDVLWPTLGRARQLQHQLAERRFDLIITHYCTLLPLAFAVKDTAAKVMLDAKEYYPGEFVDQWRWRLLTKPVNEYLCAEYLHRCDKIITVSDGLAQRYRTEYAVQPEVIMSLPTFRPLAPAQTNDRAIRIVHHGWANPSRRTEIMIEMMDYVDGRFALDLMLVVDRSKYWDRMATMANQRENVRIIPPVSMQDIVPFTNRYDIGVFLCKPTNPSLEYTLPNKLFEFIQARLAVAIGPSIEMKRILEEYGCGVVSTDFEPQSLAKELNGLTADRIMSYKMKSHAAASELSAETSRARVKEIVSELVGR